MTPGKIRKMVVAQRTAWIREMVRHIRALPLGTVEMFLSDPRNVAAAESYLRRALEALHDLGRHVLAKGLGEVATEYKAVAGALEARQVLAPEQAALLRKMAGYRNRMVHFYNEVTPPELYRICTAHLDEVEEVLQAVLDWVAEHQDLLDG
jgi:uncharacterized protein YutE (UPF0331/DUF86 family)